jgi:hypothetical protein
LIIARSSIVAARGCLPASNFGGGDQNLVVIFVDVVRAFRAPGLRLGREPIE